MPLTLSHCLPTDAPELARVSAAIWLPIPNHKTAWGKVPEPELLKKYEKDFYDSMTVQKQTKLPQQKYHLKVTDDATGEIAAYAIWICLPEGYCVEDEYVCFCFLFGSCLYILFWARCAVLERFLKE